MRTGSLSRTVCSGWRLVLAAVVCLLGLAACASIDSSTKQRQVASMLAYLFPGNEQPAPQPDTVSVIQVPFRVGIAFVPDNGNAEFRLSEADRIRLGFAARVELPAKALQQMTTGLQAEVQAFRERAPRDAMIRLVLPPGYKPVAPAPAGP